MHEDGFHSLGADLQPAVTNPDQMQRQLRASAETAALTDSAYGVFHASLGGRFQGTLPAGTLRIDHAPAQGAVNPRTSPTGTAAAPYREALLLADGDVL